jgi:hypothetical protein
MLVIRHRDVVGRAGERVDGDDDGQEEWRKDGMERRWEGCARASDDLIHD